jgi:calcium-dependent protein kinase
MSKIKTNGKTSAKSAANRSRMSKGENSNIQKGILQSHKIDVYKKYTEIEVLGNGSMGHVAKVVLKESKSIRRSIDSSNDSEMGFSTAKISSGKPATYALKSIQLDRISSTFVTELKNEIDILNTMDHPNIVKLHEVITHKRQIYLVQECCDGGDLYTRLPYTEKDSAYITGKLLSAIKYMHDHAIVHRDRKFILRNTTGVPWCKYVDRICWSFLSDFLNSFFFRFGVFLFFLATKLSLIALVMWIVMSGIRLRTNNHY